MAACSSSSLPLFDDDSDAYETSQNVDSSSDEDLENEPPNAKKHRQKCKEYKHVKSFKDHASFEWLLAFFRLA